MANTDDIQSQPVWVIFDPVACGIILRREIEDQVDSKVWQMYGINRGFFEDKWPSEFEGVVVEPSFDWIGHITGQRRSDETCFYSVARISKVDISPPERRDQVWVQGGGDKINLPHLMAIVQSAITHFNSFSNCECKVGTACTRHAMTGFTGDTDDD